MRERFFLLILCLHILLIPAIGQGGKTAAELLTLGNAAFAASQYKEAVQLYDESIRMDPALADAYGARGAARDKVNDLQGAHTDYNIYLEWRPDDTGIALARGILRYKMGLYEPALTDFRKVLSMPPGETRSLVYRQSSGAKGADGKEADKAFLLNEMGLCETKLSRFKEAVQHFDSAIALTPSATDFLVNRGIAREGLNDDVGAVTDYEKALTQNPDHSLAKHNLGVVRRRQGKGLEEKAMNAMESDSSMLSTYMERAFQRYQSGYFKGALEDYKKALEIDSSDAELWITSGMVREKLKDFVGAQGDYSQAIRMNAKAEKAYLSRGDVLVKLSRYREAIDDYSAAISLGSDYALAYYNRGLAYQRLKQTTEACADITKAASLGMAVEKKVLDKACSAR